MNQSRWPDLVIFIALAGLIGCITVRLGATAVLMVCLLMSLVGLGFNVWALHRDRNKAAADQSNSKDTP
jgi:hypothetical protein